MQERRGLLYDNALLQFDDFLCFHSGSRLQTNEIDPCLQPLCLQGYRMSPGVIFLKGKLPDNLTQFVVDDNLNHCWCIQLKTDHRSFGKGIRMDPKATWS